jgi:hypothetical protein
MSVYLVTYEPGVEWNVDGPYAPAADLTAAFQSLNRIGPQPVVLRLTVGAAMPTIENVTAAATAAGQGVEVPDAA